MTPYRYRRCSRAGTVHPSGGVAARLAALTLLAPSTALAHSPLTAIISFASDFFAVVFSAAIIFLSRLPGNGRRVLGFLAAALCVILWASPLRESEFAGMHEGTALVAGWIIVGLILLAALFMRRQAHSPD